MSGHWAPKSIIVTYIGLFGALGFGKGKSRLEVLKSRNSGAVLRKAYLRPNGLGFRVRVDLGFRVLGFRDWVPNDDSKL